MYDKALKSYQNALLNTKDNLDRAKIYHNIGNTLLKDKKVKESVESYKKALRLNPNDEATKYNLSYALNLLKNQNQKNKNNKNNKNDKNNKDQKNKNDKNKQNNKNDKDKQNKQNQDQNKNKQDKNKQDQKQKQDQQKQNKNNQAKQDNVKQQQPNKISKAEAERILEALKQNEQKLQKQLRKHKGKPVKTDKDW